jgi:hypothetical protein
MVAPCFIPEKSPRSLCDCVLGRAPSPTAIISFSLVVLPLFVSEFWRTKPFVVETATAQHCSQVPAACRLSNVRDIVFAHWPCSIDVSVKLGMFPLMLLSAYHKPGHQHVGFALDHHGDEATLCCVLSPVVLCWSQRRTRSSLTCHLYIR